MTHPRWLMPLAAALMLAAPATARAQATPICHATGDPNRPYQQIEVSPDASIEHLQHAEDIVPAPPEGCPAQIVPDEVDPAYPLPTVTATPEADVLPDQARRPRRRRPRPSRCEGSRCAPAGNLGATATMQSETLPMTGAEVPGIALMGLGFLLAGIGMRLRFVAS